MIDTTWGVYWGDMGGVEGATRAVTLEKTELICVSTKFIWSG